MTDPVEVTVVAPNQWTPRTEQLAAILHDSIASRVIPDPTGHRADPNNLAVFTDPSAWASDPLALAEALQRCGPETSPTQQSGSGTSSSAVSPVEDRLVYTVEEAAALLAISRSFAYEAVQRGEIPSMRIGKRILVPKAALERFLREAGTERTD